MIKRHTQIVRIAAHAAAFFVLCGIAAQAQTLSVTTAQYGNARTGANLNEPYLNSSLVANFGKVASLPVDGLVYAQPLYVQGVNIGGTTHNVLYIVTQHNSVYALDADTQTQLWTVSMGASVPATYSVWPPCPDNNYTGPELGILSTPVIDTSTNTLYGVFAKAGSPGTGYGEYLFALDLSTGAQKFNSPALLTASAASTTAPDNVGGVISIDPLRTIQRPGLLLSGGTVTIGLSGCGSDPHFYHGWLLGYNASNLSQTFSYTPTPQTWGGGIWQSGRGLVADSSGSIYLETGNGDNSETSDLGNSVVQFSASGKLSSWFTPSNRAYLDFEDLDIGASGPILTPDTNLLLAGGKEGEIYMLNPKSLSQPSNLLQTITVGAQCFIGYCGGARSLAYWPAPSGGGALYSWPARDVLHELRYVNQSFSQTGTYSLQSSYPGGILTVSANSATATSAILWAQTGGVLYAFDALSLTHLWDSNQNSFRDGFTAYSRTAAFTVAAGRAFVPDGGNDVVVYEPLVPPPTPQCPVSPALQATSYSGSVVATGGVPPYRSTFLSSGSLPAGLTQNGATVSGTPTQAGTFNFTETVVDGRNNSRGTGMASCSITVTPVAISGFVYTDVGNNKKYDPSIDTPLAGVTVQFQGPGGVNETTVTAADGSYSFVNTYPKGGYHVKVPGKAGNNQGLNTPGSISINLVGGQDYPNSNFGYKTPPPPPK